MPLDRTRALMADLAAVIGLPGLPAEADGGWKLEVGEGNEVLVYGGDDVAILVIVPLAPLPPEPGYALVNYLLRLNMFDADTAPFVVAVDEGGTLVLWGRLAIAEIDGAGLARLLDNLAELAAKLRAEIGED